MKPYKCVALAQSKHRDHFALMGIEVRESEKKVDIALAKGWERHEISQIVPDVKRLLYQIGWRETWVDQSFGEHLIMDMRQEGMHINVINTQKEMRDPSGINNRRVMDRIEMVQWMYEMKINHKISFPTIIKGRTTTMSEVEHQLSTFSEHKTESGNIDYYAPGDEQDDFIRALMILCFSVRRLFLGNTKRYSSTIKIAKQPEFESILDGAQVSLSPPIVVQAGTPQRRYRIR